MYLLFRIKNWKPSDYYNMPESEKRITQIFLREEIEERRKEAEEIEREKERMDGL